MVNGKNADDSKEALKPIAGLKERLNFMNSFIRPLWSRPILPALYPCQPLGSPFTIIRTRAA
jgi:hypothetical protein